MKKEIRTTKAPAAIGPYSQAIEAGNLIFTSGMIPIDPETGALVTGSVEEQTRQALTNLKHLIEASGASMENVLKTVVFISDMENFGTINEIYETFFTAPYPARSCVQVARLPKDVAIEIEAVVARD